MHSWHFDDWAFHANGDPVPGHVIINRRAENQPQFRTTAEELVTFVVAAMLRAAPHHTTIMLYTTQFTLDGENVELRVRDQVQEIGDAEVMIVPFAHLKVFVRAMAERKFEYCMTDHDIDTTMAGMGVYLLMTTPRKDDC